MKILKLNVNGRKVVAVVLAGSMALATGINKGKEIGPAILPEPVKLMEELEEDKSDKKGRRR